MLGEMGVVMKYAYGCPPPRGLFAVANFTIEKSKKQACQSAGLFVFFDLNGFMKNVDLCHVFYKAIFMPFFKGRNLFLNCCA